MSDDLQSRVGKILWAAMGEDQSPKPYLCIKLNDGRLQNSLAECKSVELVDLESGATCVLLAVDIEHLSRQNSVWWDDSHERPNRTGVGPQKDVERIRFLVKQVPQPAGENEVYLAYHYDECVVEEFETECLEDDEDWERLA